MDSSTTPTTNRWSVAFACAWINLLIFATYRSSGVLYLALLDTFKCTHQQAAWPLSMIGSVASLTGIACTFSAHYLRAQTLVFCGILCCAVSLLVTGYPGNTIQTVTFTIGVLHGIGVGVVVNVLPSVLTQNFCVRKKSLALGISYAGATGGAFVFPVMLERLFAIFGFNQTMMFMGGITLMALFGCFWLQTPSSPTTTTSSSTSSNSGTKKIWNNFLSDYILISNRHFLLCTFTYINFIFNFITFIVILPDVGQDLGFKPHDTTWLLSVFSIIDFIGRFTPGWFAHFALLTDRTLYIGTSALLGATVCALTVFASAWTHLIVISAIAGATTGIQIVLSPAILADYFGASNTATTYGMANFIAGAVTLVLRPVLIGGIKDRWSNYRVLGGIVTISILLNTIGWIIELACWGRRPPQPPPTATMQQNIESCSVSIDVDECL